MKKLLALAAIAAAGFGAYRWHEHGKAVDATEVGTSDAKLVRDRVWIDHLPRNDRESVEIFLAVSRQAIGVFQQASQWRGVYEGFRFEQNGDELRLHFPQTGSNEKVRARATRCNERGMQYCLEIEGASRGVKKYYSRDGWEIRSLDEERAKLDAIESAGE